MNIDTQPLSLFKANLELQLRLTRLLQENGQKWIESAAQSGDEGIAETTAKIEALLKAKDWQALTTLPSHAFWRTFQQSVAHTQEANQLAIAGQTAFAQGLQQALQEWQRATVETIGSANGPQPLLDFFKQWGNGWGQGSQKATENGGSGNAK